MKHPIQLMVSLMMAVTCSTLWAGLPIQHWNAINGSRVYLIESHSLPMLDIQIDFDAGSRRDPAGLTGLAKATAEMMSKGVRPLASKPGLDENQLGEAWADLGASFVSNVSNDRMSFQLRSLTDPDLLTAAIDLAVRQLGQPSFPEKTWQIERARSIAALKESNTHPANLAQKTYLTAVYGGHPYGNQTTEDSFQAIKIEDMLKLHAKLDACHASVSLVGDIDRQQAEHLVETLLQLMPASQPCPKLPEIAEVEPLKQAQTIKIQFEAAQAQVLIGQPGIKRNNPDYFPLFVGNYILGGGGFVSRLTEQVREKRGLSYSVYSYFSPGFHAGAFTAGLQTRPDQADQAIQLTHEVIHEFVQNGPTEKELQAAKDNLIGGFPLRLDSNRKLLDNLANIGWYQLPLDYLDNWTRQIEKITIQDIHQAFSRTIQPDKLITLVLGAK
jgi:zinc protease